MQPHCTTALNRRSQPIRKNLCFMGHAGGFARAGYLEGGATVVSAGGDVTFG